MLSRHHRKATSRSQKVDSPGQGRAHLHKGRAEADPSPTTRHFIIYSLSIVKDRRQRSDVKGRSLTHCYCRIIHSVGIDATRRAPMVGSSDSHFRGSVGYRLEGWANGTCPGRAGIEVSTLAVVAHSNR